MVDNKETREKFKTIMTSTGDSHVTDYKIYNQIKEEALKIGQEA